MSYKPSFLSILTTSILVAIFTLMGVIPAYASSPPPLLSLMPTGLPTLVSKE
ncbi:MAG TPA: hypothetical protein VEV19_00770 [Ktedonobacteraceae bacterium]|nr:hypothetical protein [Ktedonobacteraceae bacterium]